MIHNARALGVTAFLFTSSPGLNDPIGPLAFTRSHLDGFKIRVGFQHGTDAAKLLRCCIDAGAHSNNTYTDANE